MNANTSRKESLFEHIRHVSKMNEFGGAGQNAMSSHIISRDRFRITIIIVRRGITSIFRDGGGEHPLCVPRGWVLFSCVAASETGVLKTKNVSDHQST